MRLRLGELVLDPDRRQLWRGSEEVHLQPKAFELLDLLVRSRPRAVSKAKIRAHIWPITAVSDASLTVLVGELRKALGDDADRPSYVRTVYGFGYAFAGDVEEDRPESLEGAPRVLWEKRIIPLADGENVLGRDEGVSVRIDAKSVSRRHARIRVAGGAATLEDLGSKNGTFLGEGATRLAAPVALTDGARFSLGSVRLVFRSTPEDGSTATERRG